jgi:hypothetical protein
MGPLILRKQGRIFDWISFPADAFSTHRPCFRATSLLFSRKETRKSEGGQGENKVDKEPAKIIKEDMLLLIGTGRKFYRDLQMGG